MEDEGRPLPPGWIRQYDSENHHQFFVDTTKDPPRSIWQHPYDDDEYMNSLDPKERQRIRGSLRVPNHDDIAAESSDDERESHPSPQPGKANTPANTSQPSAGPSKFGRKLKDKLTGTTHEQREEQRRQRAIAEQEAYERHRQLRAAMVEAMRSGQPQFIGKDANGKDIYIEPPPTAGMGPGGYGRGYNPYAQGVYANPNARFIRPANPYQRPYGGGYGGGYGLPLAGGLVGGMMLGSMMGGGFGGDYGGDGFGGGDFGGGDFGGGGGM